MNNIVVYRCRTCLSENISELFDWNSPMEEGGASDEITYVECYQECTQIEASSDDSFPQTICYQCAEQMRDAFYFIKRAKESHKSLLMKQKLILIPEYDDQHSLEEDVEWISIQKTEDDNESNQFSPLPNSPSLSENDFEDFEDYYPEHSNSAQSTHESLDPHVEFEAPAIDDKQNLKQKRGRPKIIETLTEEELNATTKCEFCNETLLMKDLKRHIAARKHTRPKLLCHACPRVFKDVTSLRTHAESHDENRKRKHCCDQCSRRFFTRTSYLCHMKIHDKNRQVFECEQCDKTFFHKGSLRLHIKQHNGGDLQCNVCSKKYVRAFDLTIHMRTHSGDNPYKCNYCEKSFAQRGAWKKHIRQHEGYRYKCDICDKEYVHQSTLINHRKEHTGLPFKCSLCGKGFVKNSKIRRHIGGVHKIQEDAMDEFIVKVKTTREYRARDIDTCY